MDNCENLYVEMNTSDIGSKLAQFILTLSRENTSETVLDFCLLISECVCACMCAWVCVGVRVCEHARIRVKDHEYERGCAYKLRVIHRCIY